VYGGDGLARLPGDERGPGKAVFVPFVIEGETIDASLVEQKRGFARAELTEVIESSPQRTQPDCPYFQRCGGCQYQQISYEHQLRTKAVILRENLRRLAKIELDAELWVHPSPPWNYRNRARLKVRSGADFAIGYYRWNSHELQPVERCPISSPLINRAITAFERLKSAPNLDAIREVEFFADHDDNQLLVEVDCKPDIRPKAAEHLAQLIKETLPEIAGVVVLQGEADGQKPFGTKQIAQVGMEQLQYQVNELSYRVSAGAFFQVNRYQIAKLVELVTTGCSGASALDLYAGVGLFSKVLPRSFAQVTAVEPSPTAHADLLYNSTPNVKAVRATTEQFLKGAGGQLRPTVVVVDPPRSGLGEMVVRSLAGLDAERIVYVSCDPATLSRDLAGLLGAGYGVQQAHVVDLFPQTYHVESVFHLTRAGR